MVFEGTLKRLKSAGQVDCDSLKIKERRAMQRHGFFRFQSHGNDETVLSVDGDQSPVECAVVERTQTESVLWVSAQLD